MAQNPKVFNLQWQKKNKKKKPWEKTANPYKLFKRFIIRIVVHTCNKDCPKLIFSSCPLHFHNLSALFNKDSTTRGLPQPLQIFIDFNFHTHNCWACTPKHGRLRSVIPYYVEQGMHMDERALWREVMQNWKASCEDQDVGIWQWQAASNGKEER